MSPPVKSITAAEDTPPTNTEKIMKNILRTILTTGLTGLLVLGTTGVSSAAVIDFTGGDIYEDLNENSIGEPEEWKGTTDNKQTFSYQDLLYVENGFQIEFWRDFGGSMGNVYQVAEDHEYGDVLQAYGKNSGKNSNISVIRVTRTGGGLFNLNSFDLISNTSTDPSAEYGASLYYNHKGNSIEEYLEVEPEGFNNELNPEPKIILDEKFKEIDEFYFRIDMNVDSFSIDNLDVEPIDSVPEPGTLWLLGGTLAGLAMTARQRKTA